MGRVHLIVVLSLSLTLLCLFSRPASAQLKRDHYATICPGVNVEGIVKAAVKAKFDQTFVTIPATIRLFFHDCFVNGCDASVMIQSTDSNTAEKDHEDNISLAGDGFDTVIKARQAIDQKAPSCRNKVSCADVLALATRDAIVLAGGPTYPVELGRLDGFTSTAASVNGRLPHPNFTLKQLNSMFASNGLTQADMIALSAAHTVGFSHCSKFANRLYSFSRTSPVDPTLDKNYANELKQMCPRNVDPSIAINMDPNTPRKFDNIYFKNLQQRKGLFTSDQVLFEDAGSKPTVNAWAADNIAFQKAFINAITKLGRVGVKTGRVGVTGKIRAFCDVL